MGTREIGSRVALTAILRRKLPTTARLGILRSKSVSSARNGTLPSRQPTHDNALHIGIAIHYRRTLTRSPLPSEGRASGSTTRSSRSTSRLPSRRTQSMSSSGIGDSVRARPVLAIARTVPSMRALGGCRPAVVPVKLAGREPSRFDKCCEQCLHYRPIAQKYLRARCDCGVYHKIVEQLQRAISWHRQRTNSEHESEFGVSIANRQRCVQVCTEVRAAVASVAVHAVTCRVLH